MKAKNLVLFFTVSLLIVMSSCSVQPLPFHQDSSIALYRPHHRVVVPQHRKIVLVGGCFDVVHYGHIRFLEHAHKAGGPESYLIVALEPDHRIIRSKKRQPVHTQQERAHILASIRYVDKVLLLGDLKTDTEYDQLVQDIKPDIIAVTADDPQTENKRAQSMRIGATLNVVMDRIKSFASSRIIAPTQNLPVSPIAYTNTVHEGIHMARTLGYPTANIIIHPPYPRPGVYSGLVTVGGKTYPSMCYYDDKRPETLEAHLFDTHQNLYSQEITITLKTFIRAPQKFEDLKTLKQCIDRDALLCRQD